MKLCKLKFKKKKLDVRKNEYIKSICHFEHIIFGLVPYHCEIRVA